MFFSLEFKKKLLYSIRMINKKTKGNTMIKDLNKFCNMINDVDSQLYEIAKILKKYDSSLNVEDLMNNVLDQIESNVANQVKNKQ